ncbi:MAG TPA: hypothetical protein VM409_04670 [Chloroflexia bacterium]|nr:hypothetical protein [Chloroflexia bacterium]
MKTSQRNAENLGHFQVFYPEQADLYLGDSVPLYLSWIIKTSDGNFYTTPAEEGGWNRRHSYKGGTTRLKQVPSERAQPILHLVLAGAQPVLSNYQQSDMRGAQLG